MPDITRTDISITFSLLLKAGLGEKITLELPVLSN